ncbi:hypothetical protein RUMOBE_02327 [Blautia obeum ATCC 29174]|uniref:Uncharacterized protein n=1 Tax=Blautia obeum ATCC 29174 TaxID=411459 RepID=A5ZTJ7_9FIRM|nr:hypothetical protein RUMOBE_02327 [Blautia obeum ATCC 29174]
MFLFHKFSIHFLYIFHRILLFLCKIDFFRMLCLYCVQHLLCEIEKQFDLSSIFFDDHRVIRSIVIIRGIIIFFQLLRTTVFFIFSNTFVPVRRNDFQLLQLQYMGSLTILFAIDHINAELIIFQGILIILLAENIKHKIKRCKKKSCQHKGLGYCNSQDHKDHCKQNHYFPENSGHAFFLSGDLLHNLIVVHINDSFLFFYHPFSE